jgi:REP element-mobilizing transposase RayT
MSEFRTISSRPNEPPMPDPLAFFLTWPTYGTWLPGDARGWVKYGKGFQLPDPIRELEAKARMTEDACRLDFKQRQLVESTVRDHCRIRGWYLHAVNCRSNHLHSIVSANRKPEDVREQFKAWCTRKLKEFERKRIRARRTKAKKIRENWWAERGSERHIADEESLEAAILYVLDGQ